jgi:hypothetical protein
MRKQKSKQVCKSVSELPNRQAVDKQAKVQGTQAHTQIKKYTHDKKTKGST